METLSANADRLRIVSCPFRNGLRNVSLAAGATRLSADGPLLAGIADAGRTLEHGEIDADGFDQAVADLSRRVERVYLHVDLDAIDSAEARANQYAAPGGPSLDRLSDCVKHVCGRFDVAAAAITAYDPDLDDDARTLKAARRISSDIAHGAHG
jgi:arginase family enzyme